MSDGMMEVVITDGGRAEAGFKGKTEAGDCVARAFSIASGIPYGDVYARLAEMSASAGGRRSARDGVKPSVMRKYAAEIGMVWTPTMSIGSGCRVHLRSSELPAGRLVARLSGHVCAVVDGVIHDNYDPSRGGTRCVYGFWSMPDR